MGAKDQEKAEMKMSPSDAQKLWMFNMGYEVLPSLDPALNPSLHPSLPCSTLAMRGLPPHHSTLQMSGR